jgi:hypothetical protein
MEPMQIDLAPGSDAAAIAARLASQGCAVVGPEDLAALAKTDRSALSSLEAFWEDLVPDAYLKDVPEGAPIYRLRRHGSFVLGGDGVLHDHRHRPHWQPTTYNALHGGMLRPFEPLAADFATHDAFRSLVAALGEVHRTASGARDDLFVEVHPFRITTAGGVGRPTPEGAHRDGVDFVAVVLISREGIIGGETRIFAADSPGKLCAPGVRFTLTTPWTAVLLDDARVIHESTPIQPAAPRDADGHRDTLVITYRRGGFQEPAVVAEGVE